METGQHPDPETCTKSGLSSFAPHKLIEFRSKGMQMVRFEFIKRLLQLNIQISTLSIYWEDGRNFIQIPTMQNVLRKLVCASVPRVSGKFDDRSLLRYACDAEARATVDAELDQMIAAIENYWQKQPGTTA